MRTAVIGGGPGGLFLARLLALAEPDADVHVYERGSSDAAAGFGLVFSGRALAAVNTADPETGALIRRAGVSWTDLELRLPDRSVRYGDYQFTALPRRELLRVLRGQAAAAGARLHFERRTTPADVTADVVVLADGAGSRNRDALSGSFGSQVSEGRSKYIWFSTSAPFDAMTFPFVTTEYGAIGAHAHPYGDGVSSFLVETDESTLAAAGPALASTEQAQHWLGVVFSDHLGGRPLVPNGSRWSSFRVVHNERWSAGNVVLLGDAAHTAHFSIGSGTAMAMKDSIALAHALRGVVPGDRVALTSAFADYERTRRDSVVRAQDLAVRSMRWWETFGRRMHLPSARFAAHFITRTGLVGLRDAGCPDIAGTELRLGPVLLRNRLVTAEPEPGAGLVIATDPADWPATRAAAARSGAVFGAVVTSPLNAPDAYAAGARVIELPLASLVSPSSGDHRLDAADAAFVAGATCPEGPAGSSAGDELVDTCRLLRVAGVAAVRLRGGGCWDHVLAHADRVQSETGLSAMVEVPAGPFAERVLVALATGRVDLIAATTSDLVSRPRALADV